MRASGAVQQAILPRASHCQAMRPPRSCRSRTRLFCAKKIRRAGGARRISPTSFQTEAGGPSQGECLAANRVSFAIASPGVAKSPGSAVESGEMIPPASQAGGDLVHMARARHQEFCFASSVPLTVARDENCNGCCRNSRCAGRSAGSRPSFGFNSARSRKASA
jgi:hypothetical protein